jgi:hypothetical protein
VDVASLSLYLNRPFDTKAHDGRHTLFDVERSTCPQCLDSDVSINQPFDLYIDVNTNQMHYAWQAGVRCLQSAEGGFISFFFDLTGRPRPEAKLV